jgi:hypothetical protein
VVILWKWIGFYSLAFILGILIAMFQWPFWIAIAVLILTSLLMIGEVLFTLYGTTNMKRAEKFILKKKKEPIYQFIYSQGFGTKENQILAIDAILKKYKQQHIYYYYRCIQQYLKDNLELALEDANKIGREPLMSYSKGLIYARMGNEEEALSHMPAKRWMQEAILATIAHNKHDATSFEQHVENAIQSTRGLQRLSLIYAFNQMRN